MLVSKNVNARTYTRTDIGTNKVGFIADEWVQNTPPEWSNIWNVDYPSGLLQLDYARTGAVLWTVCQEQQNEIETLAAQVAALEAKKRTTKTT